MTETITIEFNGANFVGFMKKLNPKLRAYRPNGVWVTKKEDRIAAFDIIMNNISYKIAETAPTKEKRERPWFFLFCRSRFSNFVRNVVFIESDA
jgi:hypothetical protein